MKQDFGDRINVVKKYGDIPQVTCYASELNQVFMHLLRNAVEAIRGPGTITIRSFTDAGKVRVQVADSGVGMSPEQLRPIFDPALTRKGSRVRAGLGLFTSYRIVEQHNGEIRIDSHLGEGTTVTVTLPAV